MACNGYVSTLTSTSTRASTMRAPDVVFDDETLQGLSLEDEETDITSRQTGDWSIYLYYFQNIGRPLLSLFFICSVLFTFGLIFPRMQTGCFFATRYLLTWRQKFGSSGGPSQMRLDRTEMSDTG